MICYCITGGTFIYRIPVIFIAGDKHWQITKHCRNIAGNDECNLQRNHISASDLLVKSRGAPATLVMICMLVAPVDCRQWILKVSALSY